MPDPILVRVRQLRDKARTHAANNSYSAAPLIEELAAIVEELILDDWSRAVAMAADPESPSDV